MKKNLSIVSVIIITIAFLMAACDSNNSICKYADDIENVIDLCPQESPSFVLQVDVDIIPTNYSVESICWTDESEILLSVNVAIPVLSSYKLILLDNCSRELESYSAGLTEAGLHSDTLDVSDYVKKIYGLRMQAGDYDATVWYKTE